MIYVLGPKDKKRDCLTINTTTSSKDWSRGLSPMLLGPVKITSGIPAFESENVENAWQFSKVYKEHTDKFGNPTIEHWKWAARGFLDSFAHRYPMGKGAIPEYSIWNGERLNYIEARKKIYIPIYSKAVVESEAFTKLKQKYVDNNKNIALWDFDGYDHVKLGMTLEQVLNDPSRKMGHAFVLAMMLEGKI
jgi:hypothetical protein